MNETPTDRNRRGFLKGLGLATATTAAVPLVAAMTAPEAQAMRARPDERAARYRLSEHIKRYYELNRR